MPSLWVFPRESWVQDPHPTNRTATCLVVELELVDETPCDNSGLSRNRQDWNRNRKIHARIGRRSLPSRRLPRRNDPKGNRRLQSEDPSSRYYYQEPCKEWYRLRDQEGLPICALPRIRPDRRYGGGRQRRTPKKNTADISHLPKKVPTYSTTQKYPRREKGKETPLLRKILSPLLTL